MLGLVYIVAPKQNSVVLPLRSNYLIFSKDINKWSLSILLARGLFAPYAVLGVIWVRDAEFYHAVNEG